jgi:hypothetical protein
MTRPDRRPGPHRDMRDGPPTALRPSQRPARAPVPARRRGYHPTGVGLEQTDTGTPGRPTGTPSDPLAGRVTALTRADPATVAAVYDAGRAAGRREAEAQMAAAWAEQARRVRVSAATPAYAERRRRCWGEVPDSATGRWRAARPDELVRDERTGRYREPTAGELARMRTTGQVPDPYRPGRWRPAHPGELHTDPASNDPAAGELGTDDDLGGDAA